MRRMLITSVALAATAGTIAAVPPTAGSKTPLTLTHLKADWIGSSHKIFVDAIWTPKRFETKVTLKITVNGDPLRTLKVSNWVIGHKLFKLTVPSSVADGSKARIEARVQSEAGVDHRVVSLDLP
jgi:hypothetical protein